MVFFGSAHEMASFMSAFCQVGRTPYYPLRPVHAKCSGADNSTSRRRWRCPRDGRGGRAAVASPAADVVAAASRRRL